MANKGILEEIKQGENIDLYLTLVLALGLALANLIISIFQIHIDYDISSLNISALFFVTITLLTNRRKLDLALELLHEFKKHDIDDSFPETYSSDIRNAKELIQTGVHLNSNLNEYYGAYRQMLDNGGKLKMLMVKPDGHAFDMAAMRFPGGVDAEQERTRAKSSLKTLEKLQEDFPSIEIKLVDYLLEYSAMIVNPTSIDSVIYIERYTFRIYGGSKKPKKVLTRNECKWFELYSHEINELWKAADSFSSRSLG